MHIALFGPSLFELAVGLRRIPGNTVEFFVDERSFVVHRELRDEPLLKDENFARISRWYSPGAFLRPKSSPIVREFRRFDTIICSEFGPLFSLHSEVPFVFLPFGGDLTSAPFPLVNLGYRLTGGAGALRLRAIIADLLRTLPMRRGIRAAEGIWLFSGPFKPWLTAIDRLGLPQPTSADCLPAAIDTEVFSPSSESRQSNAPLTVFHPSRLLISRSRTKIKTGNYKGNDILLRGVARAVAEGVDIRVIFIRHPHATDESATEDLIRELKLEDFVSWISSSHDQGFTWRELAEHYRSADIVADDFGAGWFGTVALEGAACGKPVIQPVDEDAMRVVYPDGHPFLRATNATEVAELLGRLQDQRVRDKIGEDSRLWAHKHHNPDSVGRRCMEMLEQLKIGK